MKFGVFTLLENIFWEKMLAQIGRETQPNRSACNCRIFLKAKGCGEVAVEAVEILLDHQMVEKHFKVVSSAPIVVVIV